VDEVTAAPEPENLPETQTKSLWMRSLLLLNLDLASFLDANSAACMAKAISSSS
jgi:hypothetical protein